MGTDVTEAVNKLPSPCDIKVHSVMCTKLMQLVDRVSKIIPEIEAAKPRCSDGINSLCLLISSIDKAKLLVQDCCESSKLYQALSGKTVFSNRIKLKNSLEHGLSKIRTMVSMTLAEKIFEIIKELSRVKFSLPPSEEEAGKAVRSLYDGYKTRNRSYEKEWIQIAAQRLQITSRKAISLEQKSIKKMLQQLDEGNNKKKMQKLLLFSHLLNKYEKSIASGHIENDNNVQNQDYKSQTVDFHVDHEKDISGTPPEEFKFSISNDVNTWEYSTSSVNSLSSMYSLQLPVDYSSVSLSSLENSGVVEDTPEFDDDLSKEIDDALPWEFQCKFVEDLTTRLENDDHACKFISCENLVGSLVRFLKAARETNDVKAQRNGCLLLLILVTKCRRIECLSKDAYQIIAKFLESEVIEEALAITEELSACQSCRFEIASSGSLPNIFKILDTRISKTQIPALKILHNLTSTRSVRSLIVSSDLIPKLVTLSEDDSLSRYCIAILTNLCGSQDNINIIAETNGCISFVAKALESENCEEQEHALEILLSLCSQRIQYCRLVKDEDVIGSLVLITSNGNDKGKAKALEMLRLLGDPEL
ncbi:hypothetical protein L1987_36854 [Smallanthus sonchifolius]|uniref:Uncharacterized protein n=1 Tax=Smallanthus sonchifolius TaxID=185202 RepID=A0ACB9HGK0_9ASTR|nr:hypothetical protein L1987_36854 [Smallanthus sonchifolius]